MAAASKKLRVRNFGPSVLVFHKKDDSYITIGGQSAEGKAGLLQPEQVISTADVEALTPLNRKAWDSLVDARTLDVRAA